jgi:hypothetical protein
LDAWWGRTGLEWMIICIAWMVYPDFVFCMCWRGVAN